MSALKQRIRIAIRVAQITRMMGDRARSARWLSAAGELRRTAFYVYGARRP